MLNVLQREISQVITYVNQELNVPLTNTWLEVLAREQFCVGLMELLNNNDFTGKSLIQLLIKQTNDKVAAKTWHDAIYQYALSKIFPDNADVPNIQFLYENSEIFLCCFKIVNQLEKKHAKDSFIARYPFELLTPKEVLELEDQTEYRIVLDAFKKDHIYEMMKLNREIFPYSTLEHITGVHYLALFIARQVKAAGVDVDLGLVSGAAALHDIGKFGCRKDEAHKVAYYHYYYTEVWCYNNDIEYIRNIAVNHSTWDLELESLPIESLILIYSDFRVKAHNDPAWPFPMKFYSIDASFSVILNKLDNVDDAKILRYKKVYQKLSDFESYLKYIGVQTDMSSSSPNITNYKRAAYLTGEALIDSFKRQAFKYSFAAMHALRNAESLHKILNNIRQSEDAYEIRRYLNLIEQFSKYLTPNQKIIVLDSLYDQLISRQEDLRWQSARLMGHIIASFDAPYSKYLPPHADTSMYHLSKSGVLRHYLEMFLDESNKLSKRKRQHLGLALAELFKIVIMHSDDADKTIHLLLITIRNISGEKKSLLVQALIHLDITNFSNAHQMDLSNLLSQLTKTGGEIERKLASFVQMQYDVTKNYLGKEVYDALSIHQICLLNLKSSTLLPDKLYGLNCVSQSLSHSDKDAFYLIVHLTNVVKLSAQYQARSFAMSILLSNFQRLSDAEQNEIVLDLITGIEIEDYQITKQIPKILGQLITFLSAKEVHEILDDFTYKTKMGSSLLKRMVAETVGHALKTWSKMRSKTNDDMIKRGLGILLTAFSQRDIDVHLTAFQTLSYTMYHHQLQYIQHNFEVFSMYFKKLMTIADRLPKEIQDESLNYAFGYNQLYQMLVEYRYEIGVYPKQPPSKVAYFAGTFDPFSLGQSSIASDVSEMGYDVYIDVDNLKWHRRTQPLLLRKRLIELTIASSLNVYMMPTLPTVNLAQTSGIKLLDELFPNCKISIVVGEDVLLSSEIYADKNASIYSMHHIIVSRDTSDPKLLTKMLSRFKTFETLSPDHHKTIISPDIIRTFINNNWDLDGMVDPLAERAINVYDMYKNEPTYKIAPVKYQPLFMVNDVYNAKMLSVKTHQILIQHDIIKGRFNELFIENTAEIKIHTLVDQNVLDHSMQNLHTELIVDLIEKGYEYAVVKYPKSQRTAYVKTMLKNAGYTDLDNGYSVVSLNDPVVLMLDAQSMFKLRYRNDETIRIAIDKARLKLMEALVSRHKGRLILAFDRKMLYQSIDEVVKNLNPAANRNLGEKMCVPFGDIYRQSTLPDSVTKALHIERVYEDSLNCFSIDPKQYYQDIQTQIKVIAAFDRPVILIDDLLDGALRLKSIEPHLKAQKIRAEQIIVGILTAKGRTRAMQKGYKVQSGYFLPSISAWYLESQQYPFIGGDAHMMKDGERTLVPSVNKILPYMSDIHSKSDAKEFVKYSSNCIHASQNIFKAVEKIYLANTLKHLTLSRLSEVFITPRIPYYGKRVQFDKCANPSDLLINDRLRLEQISKLL